MKPYVKRGKSDAVDAATICKAVTRPTMRFVEVKTPEQQAGFGIVLPQGVYHALQFARDCVNGDPSNLPSDAGEVVIDLCDQLLLLHSKILRLSRHMTQIAKREERVALLRTIPGARRITASAIVAMIGCVKQFKNGREFAAWLGLTPLNKSSGGKERLGHIPKMGDQYIRRLLVLGMTSRLRSTRSELERSDPWFADILSRKPSRVAAIAMTNKTARMIWAVLTRNEPYKVRTV